MLLYRISFHRFTEKPSEEEEAALDAAAEALKSGSKAGDDDALVTKLEEKAEALDWNLDNKAGIQKAQKDILALCDEAGVDLSESANMEVGKIITSNRSLPPSEIAKLVVEKYGFAEQNEAAAEKKQAAVSAVCNHEANAEIVALLLELSTLYFKEHNTNAGISYKKVAAAVAALDFEITEENAKGLGKGKTKVDGIGKGSAEKIHEYLTTGKIAKLEEKRQILAD
jgi:poly [ADP-ribose] polymerase